MTPLEAVEALVNYISYLEGSIPDYVWDEWNEYDEMHGTTGTMGVEDIAECERILRETLG